MSWKFCGNSLHKPLECPSQFKPSFRTSAARAAKGDVRSIAAQRARLAVIIVTIFHNAPMDTKYQLSRDRRIRGRERIHR